MPGPPKNYKRQKDPPSVPAFETVDNPGFWDDFVFQPKYDKKKNYLGHSLPTGAMPVPEKKGKRQCNGWEFHYQGYKGDTNFRDGASKDSSLFPEEHKGKLDADLLEKLGMTRERLEQEDFLFFYQLILPIMPIGKIEGDPQVEHYPTVAANSNGYATMALRLGCKYCFYCSVAYLPAMDLPLTILLMLFLVHR
jgi:hypothetical protein